MSPFLVSSPIALLLLIDTIATTTCHLKTVESSQLNDATYADIASDRQPWSESFLETLIQRDSSGRSPAWKRRFQPLDGGRRLQRLTAKPPAVDPSPAGYPTSAVSNNPASLSRQKLVRLLHNHAFTRPNLDDLPIHVMIKLIPIKIQDLIEQNEVLETTVRLQLSWKDKRLSWNETAFNNISEIIIPGKLIWVPDIAILNSVSDLYHVVRDTRFEMKLQSNGRIWWHPTGVVKTNCKLFLRYFPFDKQMCKFIFESPTFDLRFMNLTLRSQKSPVDTRMYTDGETWQLLGFNGKNIVKQVGSRTFFASVEFSIYIERARIYHLLNVILPAIFLSTVQVMFFLLPSTHPQRVGSSTTTLLSVVVFQTVAVAQLPKTSTDIPLLSIYIFFVVLVSGLSVGTSIIVAKFVVFAEKNVPLPNWIARIPHPVSCWQAIVCCLCCRCRIKMEREIHVQQHVDLPFGEPKSILVRDGSNGRLSNAGIDYSGDVRVRISDSPVVVDQLKRKSFEAVVFQGQKGRRLSLISEARVEQRYLFRTWADLSRFVNRCLFILAASISALSPVALFVIMPAIATDDFEIILI